MKKLLIVLLLSLSIGLYAQPKGIDYSNAIPMTSISDMNDLSNGDLLKYDSGNYVIYFRSNNVGYYKSLNRISEILSQNSLMISSPDIDNSFIREGLNYKDVDKIWTSCYVGSSIIMKVWDINGWRIAWSVDEELGPMIMIVKVS